MTPIPDDTSRRIVHVAERGENSGRVVLRLGTGDPHAIAIEAALKVAHAFQSELESLFIEDQQIIDACAHDFARELSLCGRYARTFHPRDLHAVFTHDAHRAEQRIAAMSRAAEIPYAARIMQDEPARALAIACAERGPWNVIALADPFAAGDGATLAQLLADVPGATGLVIVGPHAIRTTGPIIVAVEDIERLPHMLRAAERIAADTSERIVVLLVGDTAYAASELEAIARLALSERPDIALAHAVITYGDAAVIAETIRRMRGGFVIGHLGGLVVPTGGDLRALATVLEGPLFLVR
jgi:hypothetical protein